MDLTLNAQNNNIMNFKEIQQLIRLIDKSELTEFKMKNEGFEILIRTKEYQKNKSSQPSGYLPVSQPYVPSAPSSSSLNPSLDVALQEATVSPVLNDDADTEEVSSNVIEVRSPIVGTFYRASSPDKPPYVKVGDTIDVGSVVCIVEAMKLFNEIESEVSGKIVKVMVEDASPVEYDQVLFLVEPV